MVLKTLFTLALVTLASNNVFALDATARRQWSDLEATKKYSLDRDLTLKVDAMATPSARASDVIKLTKGLSVTLTEVVGLSEINVSLIKFSIPNCNYSTATTEILIVNPEKTGVNDPSV